MSLFLNFKDKFLCELKCTYDHLYLRAKVRQLVQATKLSAQIQMTIISLQFTKKLPLILDQAKS